MYTLNGKKLASVKQQKDLGLLVSSNMMPRNHIETICSKVNRKTGMTKRCFMNKLLQQMTKIYETVSRPVLEYASTVWFPWLKKDIVLIERTQDRALRLGNTNHVHATLEERRNRTQLMESYKYLNNYYKTPPEHFFKNNGDRTRGHFQKLLKKRAGLDQKKNPVKIIGKLNDLPANVVEAATIGSFKRRLMNHRRSLVTS